MHFRLVQRFTGGVDEVLEALTDARFLAMLGELPNLAAPQLLDQRREGDVVVQRVQYRFAGDVNRAVRAVVDPEKLTWIEESTIDLAQHESEFRMLPDHYPDRLSASGHSTFAADGDGTVRTTTGDLTVKVALVARRVENAIVSGLREHAEEEVTIFGRWQGQKS